MKRRNVVCAAAFLTISLLMQGCIKTVPPVESAPVDTAASETPEASGPEETVKPSETVKESESIPETTLEGKPEETVVETEPAVEPYLSTDRPILVLTSSKNADMIAQSENFSAFCFWDGYRVLTPGFETLQQALDQETESRNAAIEEFRATVEERVQNMEDVGMTVGGQWTYEDTASVVRADDRVTSVLRYIYTFVGGAHGGEAYVAHTYHSISGVELTLEDIVIDPDGLKVRVKEALAAKYSDGMWEGWEAIVENSMAGAEDAAAFNWTISRTGINFYYDPYILGPGAMGPAEITIPAAGNEALFHPEYFPKDELLCVKVTDYVPGEGYEYRLDTNGDGAEEIIRVMQTMADAYSYSFTVKLYGGDGETYSEETREYGFPIEDIYIMENPDGKYYLYIETPENNGFHVLYIYDINDPAGGVKFMDYNNTGSFYDIAPQCADHVFIENRLYIMGNHTGVTECHTGADGQIVSYDSEYQIIDDNGMIFLKQDMQAECFRNLSDRTDRETVLLEAGTPVHPLYTDGYHYMICGLENGCFVEFIYDKGESEWTRTINGIPDSELFNGVFYVG